MSEEDIETACTSDIDKPEPKKPLTTDLSAGMISWSVI